MRNFLVTVKLLNPYPKEYSYREQAGKIEVAIARALRKFRKEEWKGRPLKLITVTAQYLQIQKHESPN